MKRLLIVIAVVVLVLIVAGAGALMLVDVNHFRPQIQNTLSQALGREVTLGKLHVSVWSGALDADDIRIGDDPAFGTQPFVTAQSLELGVRLWPLLVHRELHVTSLTLDHPGVRLAQNRKGDWNFATLGGSGAAAPASPPSGQPLAFSVDKLRIKDGRIDLTRAVGETRSYQQVQLSADHVGMGAAFPFSMSAAIAGGGTLQLDGTLGPWNPANALLTPVDAHLVMHRLDLVGAGLMSAGAGVGGVLDIDTHIRADKGMLQSKGRIDASGLKLMAAGAPSPRPLRIDYQASYDLRSGRGQIKPAAIGMGTTHVAVGGSFDNRPKVMQLDLRINGNRLPVDDMESLLPVFGVVLPENSRLSGGSMGMDLHAHGPLDALLIGGPVSVDNSRLVGFSLGAKLGGALALAGIKTPKDTVIRHAQTTLGISPSGIRADALQADIADLGNVAGQVSMATDGRLDGRMLVKLDRGITGGVQSGQALGGLLSNSGAGRLLGSVIGGTTSQGIGVRISGTASAPAFKLDPTAVTGLLKAGVAGAKKTDSKTPAPASSKRKQDALNDLLRNALAPKKKH
jgi:AsmA protein